LKSHYVVKGENLELNKIVDLVKKSIETDDKIKINLTPEVKTVLKNMISLTPNTLNDIEKAVTEIVKDNKIDSVDIPNLIVVIQRVYQFIYSLKSVKFNSKKRAEIEIEQSLDDLPKPEIIEDNSTPKTKLLLGILLVVILIFVGVFWYQNNKDTQNNKQIEVFNNLKSFAVEIPLAVEVEEYSPDRIRGRVLNNLIDTGKIDLSKFL